jgi:hypothetical protein
MVLVLHEAARRPKRPSLSVRMYAKTCFEHGMTKHAALMRYTFRRLSYNKYVVLYCIRLEDFDY